MMLDLNARTRLLMFSIGLRRNAFSIVLRGKIASLPRVRSCAPSYKPRWSSSLIPSSPNNQQPSKPSYQITFTCKKCLHRSQHGVSKQAYHEGTVLVECPQCHVRHLMADHLKIFADQRRTLDDIVEEKIQKGTRLPDGTIEWDSS